MVEVPLYTGGCMWLRWVCIIILTNEIQLGRSLLCHLVEPLAVARVLHIVHYSTVCVCGVHQQNVLTEHTYEGKTLRQLASS